MVKVMSGGKRFKGGGKKFKRTRRTKKDETNNKGRLAVTSVGENEKTYNENELKKTFSTVGSVDINTHFEIAFRPKGEKGESPVFVKIEENMPTPEDTPRRIHNCRTLHDNKTIWLPPAMPVVIVEYTNS